jgi:outer membrane protein assembly factor BamB
MIIDSTLTCIGSIDQLLNNSTFFFNKEMIPNHQKFLYFLNPRLRSTMSNHPLLRIFEAIFVYLSFFVFVFLLILPFALPKYSSLSISRKHFSFILDSTEAQNDFGISPNFIFNEPKLSTVFRPFTRAWCFEGLTLPNHFESKVFQNNQEQKHYEPKDRIHFHSDMEYTSVEGILTFRGNHYRNAPSFGVADVHEKKLEILWEYQIGHLGSWSGVGWTGQPLILRWNEKVKEIMNIEKSFKKTDLVEVIQASLDGNIYFLDLRTGLPTREPIHFGATIKGTPTLDPRGYPLLYVGQGIDNSPSGTFEYRIYNLIDQSKLYSLSGYDPVNYRYWGAFDSSGLIDGATDTLIQAGENGLLYKMKLNSVFDPEIPRISVSPEIDKYRYSSSNHFDQGIENSPAIYKNFIYFADNAGLLQCVNLNTLKPIWVLDLEDDTDSTVVIEETEDDVFLYTGNEFDKRMKGSHFTIQNATIRKIHALTGNIVWQKNVPCHYNSSHVNGGILATPIVGKNDIDHLIIYNIAKTTTGSSGTILALDKRNGKEVWKIEIPHYSWSSPVDFQGTDEKTYGVFCDSIGNVHLFDPSSGKILDQMNLGGNIEASPSIFQDILVVGTRANKIFGVKLK